jgi:hypothetical protein
MDISVFHITTSENAKKILQEGFINSNPGTIGRVHFCKIRFLDYWKKILIKEPKAMAVLRVDMPHEFYHQEFYDWDLDEYSGGPPGEVTYGEGVFGWNDPVKRPYLQPGINCTISIYQESTPLGIWLDLG